MEDSRTRRVAALRESILQLHADALLVTSLPNIRYLTGFSGSNALLLVTQQQLHLFTDFRYETQVVDEVGDFAQVRVEHQSLWLGLWETLQKTRVEIILFESAHIIHRDFERFTRESGGAAWQWRAVVDVVEKLRESKDPGEVALIRKAADMATRALAATLGQIRAGLTETQVAGILEKALRDEGSEGFPFPSIVASGPRSALPHARTSERKVEVGDFLLLDFGAECGGYCSDITRTFVIGRASGEQREVYNIVRQANELASGQVKAGMLCKDADGIARGYIEARGFGREFGHGLGHGVGLEVHEGPRLSRIADGSIAVNAVVTIEPGVYRPGWGGVRIEDDVLVRENDGVVLTDFTRDLIEVG